MIYFIRDESNNRVKVGYAVDVHKRMNTLRTGSSTYLELLGQMEGDRATESELHRLLAPTRVSGEWFSMSGLMAEMIVRSDPQFQKLTELDSRLLALAWMVGGVEHGPKFCANLVWYQQVKPNLVELVGWCRRTDGPEELKSREAYNLVYEKLYSLLPPCQDCLCVRLEDFAESGR